jgi:hypothetical protein
MICRLETLSAEIATKMRRESWPNGVRPTHEPPSALRVPPVCKQISRRVSAEVLFLLGSVSGDGFRAVPLSRESSEYEPIVRQPTLPRWLPRQSRSLHLVRRQRKSATGESSGTAAQVLIGIARPLYAHDPIGVELDQSLYTLDSTTIDWCLSLFWLAHFRKHQAAVQRHTLLTGTATSPDFRGCRAGCPHARRDDS